MPIRPPDRRINKWDVKLKGEVIKDFLSRHKPTMRTYYTAAAEYFYDKEVKTKAILDGQGVLPSLYPMYYHFTREVGRKIYYVGLGGTALFDEVSLIRSKWVARGLDGTILDTILLEVFGILPTAGP